MTIQHNRQALFDVCLCNPFKESGPFFIEVHADIGLVILGIDLNPRIGQVLSGQIGAFLNQERRFSRAACGFVFNRLVKDFVTWWYVPFQCLFYVIIFVYELEFKQGSFSDQVNRPLGVFDPWKLY